MLVFIFIMLTLLCILFCSTTLKKISSKHIIILILIGYQYGTLFTNQDFFSFPISYWIGYFLPLIVAVVLSVHTYVQSNKKEKTTLNDNNNETIHSWEKK